MNRITSYLKKREFHFIFFIAIIAAISGYNAFRNENLTISESLYRTLQLFTLKSQEYKNHYIWFEIARWLSAFVFVYSIIKLILHFINDQIDEFAIKFYKNHIVVCGLSWKAKGIIEDLKNKKQKIIIIERNKNHEDLSEYKSYSNVKIIIGDAEDEIILSKSNICKASYVFAFTENDQTNFKISDNIHNIFINQINEKVISAREIPLKVRIHLRDYKNLMVFKEFHKNSGGKIDYHAFNLYQQAAEKVIDEYSPDQFISIRNENEKQVHILVSGLTIQGEYVILEAAQMYHFANLKKLKISIIDNEIKRKVGDFLTKFPKIENVIDILPVDTIDFNQLADFEPMFGDVSVCFICHDDDSDSINKFLNYRQIFYKINKIIDTPKIVTILPQNIPIKVLFPNLENSAKDLNVIIKVLYGDFCKKSVIVDNKEDYDNIAKYIDFIFEVNQGIIDINIGKFKQKDWDKKTDFEKDWNRYPARHFDIKLRAAGIQSLDLADKNFNINILDEDTKKLLARMEHKRWCAEKLLSGFIPGEYSIDKNAEKFLKKKLKYHPALIEWENLTLEEKVKDYYSINNSIYIAKRALIAKSIA